VIDHPPLYRAPVPDLAIRGIKELPRRHNLKIRARIDDVLPGNLDILVIRFRGRGGKHGVRRLFRLHRRLGVFRHRPVRLLHQRHHLIGGQPFVFLRHDVVVFLVEALEDGVMAISGVVEEVEYLPVAVLLAEHLVANQLFKFQRPFRHVGFQREELVGEDFRQGCKGGLVIRPYHGANRLAPTLPFVAVGIGAENLIIILPLRT